MLVENGTVKYLYVPVGGGVLGGSRKGGVMPELCIIQ